MSACIYMHIYIYIYIYLNLRPFVNCAVAWRMVVWHCGYLFGKNNRFLSRNGLSKADRVFVGMQRTSDMQYDILITIFENPVDCKQILYDWD